MARRAGNPAVILPSWGSTGFIGGHLERDTVTYRRGRDASQNLSRSRRVHGGAREIAHRLSRSNAVPTRERSWC
jgi:hypothetical protein